MKSAQLQGFALMAGAPNAVVSKLSEVGVTLVPVAPEVAAVIHRHHPFQCLGTIAGDVYQGVAPSEYVTRPCRKSSPMPLPKRC